MQINNLFSQKASNRVIKSTNSVITVAILCILWAPVHAETDVPATQAQQYTAPSNLKGTVQLSSKPSSILNNPYQLLVSLAFGTKNVLGIQSYAQAYDYFCLQARDSSDANAQFAMGWMYSMGKGVEVNHDVAAIFFNMAAAQGHLDAKEWLEKKAGDAAKASLPTCMEKPLLTAVENTSAESFPDPNDLFYKHGPIYHMVKKHARTYEIDVDFAMAVIAVESGFNPKATSPKNAQGLMQLMPETQARFNVIDAYDAEQNIKGGLSYLRWLLAYFKGDVELVAAAYNAGEKNVVKYQGVPPFPETLEYIKRFSKYYKRKYHDYRQDLNIPYAPISRIRLTE